MMLLLEVLIISALMQIVHGYSNGAPAGQCDQMTPGHGVAPQVGSAPYMIHLSKNTFSCKGEKITVTVNGTTPFKGFLCQPRSSVGTYKTVGTLTPVGQTPTNNNCQPNAALTHANSMDKSEISFEWMADDSTGNLQIVCSLVQTKSTFWVKQTSEMLTYVQGTCSSGAKKTKSKLPFITLASIFLLFAFMKK